MNTPLRVLLVTIGLMIAGSVLGAIAAGAAMFVAVSAVAGVTAAADGLLIGIASLYGSLLGGILAPIASWLFLRQVPLGRAMAWTTVAAVTGGTAGWIVAATLRSRYGGPLPLLGEEAFYALAGAGAFFAGSVLFLRMRHARLVDTGSRRPNATS